MESVSIHRPKWLPKGQLAALREAQREAAREWMDRVAVHKQARDTRAKWPTRDTLQKFTKGRYKLHSQTIQMIVQQFLANVEATTERRRNDPASRQWLRYPHREKTFFPLYWPAQAVSYDRCASHLILPMGRGRKSLVFRVALDFEPGAVKLVWKDGYELHIVRGDVVQAEASPGEHRACVDLGEIHQAAVATDTGAALVICGRGMRSHKRLLSKQLGALARKRARCKRGSRRWKKLQRARRKRSLLARRRIRDLRHKGTRKVIDFCVQQKVGTLFIGDPRGVRTLKAGRHHNQRISRWEVGQDMDYLRHKAERASIACSIGNERRTSSRCPQCGHRHRPKGRDWQCKACGFVGHRDVVGAANMHQNAFGVRVTFPARVTYRRAGPMRAARGLNSPAPSLPARRSSPDTGLREGVAPPSPQLLGTSPPQGRASDPRRDAGLPVRRQTLPSAA
ncbi:RNA-guided endonuclease InsQ/TnpB family protein [Microvirga massiliensis]|uniref:RNA-guided endonuclease InsQ/TnpB family protein n=1 Tax=Microvirga massiliensis TaxID=1033741 RepID=UPI00062B641E|nr:RNA-guided endonuclease TnpB family protein [Microvirga massiliensis]